MEIAVSSSIADNLLYQYILMRGSEQGMKHKNKLNSAETETIMNYIRNVLNNIVITKKVQYIFSFV